MLFASGQDVWDAIFKFQTRSALDCHPPGPRDAHLPLRAAHEHAPLRYQLHQRLLPERLRQQHGLVPRRPRRRRHVQRHVQQLVPRRAVDGTAT